MAQGEEKGILGRVLDKITGAKKETSLAKRKREEKKEAQKEVNQAIDTLLKDAPLPFKLAAPFMKSVAGMVQTSLAESQSEIKEVVELTRQALSSDPQAKALLGSQIMCDAPFSSSFSSVDINGQVSKQIQLGFQVQGSSGSGTVAVSATNTGDSVALGDVFLQCGMGKAIKVQTDLAPSSSDNDDIIDVEIV